MSAHKRYKVVRAEGEVFEQFVKPKVALEWVARGLAELSGKDQVRMLVLNKEVVRSSRLLRSGGQDEAYELAAIDPNRHFVQGGGVNGHRRQLGLELFSGAKIGHQ